MSIHLFFFQAEDGIRDADVTGVQTCALPICVTCHRPGEAAPFSLITYDDVRKRGAMIAKVTQARFMPPWQATHGFGEFLGERRLTDAQIQAIAAWVSAGMPQGNPSRMLPLPKFPDGWRLGTPD